MLGLDKGWRKGRYRCGEEVDGVEQGKVGDGGDGGRSMENGGDGNGVKPMNEVDLAEKGEGGSEPRRRRGSYHASNSVS